MAYGITADGVPNDGALQERIHPNSLILISVYSVVAIAGIVYAVVCLLFNLIFRNRRLIHPKGPKLYY